MMCHSHFYTQTKHTACRTNSVHVFIMEVVTDSTLISILSLLIITTPLLLLLFELPSSIQRTQGSHFTVLSSCFVYHLHSLLQLFSHFHHRPQCSQEPLSPILSQKLMLSKTKACCCNNNTL